MDISIKLNYLQQHQARRKGENTMLNLAHMSRIEYRQQTRRARFTKIRHDRFKTSAAMADKLGEGFSPSFVSQLLSGHRGIGDELADKIEAIMDLPFGYLDLPDDSLIDEIIFVLNNTTDEGRTLLQSAAKTVQMMYPRSGQTKQIAIAAFSLTKQPH